MTYITVKEASEKWNISSRRICILCCEGRIPGAEKKSKVWMIPENAKKPEDGRSSFIDKTIDPAFLLINPTYFETNAVSAPYEEARAVCNIQNDFFSGNMDKAYSDLNRLMENNKNEQYYALMLILKFLFSSDMGKNRECLETIGEIERICINKDWTVSSIIRYHQGITEAPEAKLFDAETYSLLRPIISIIAAKRTINNALKNGAVAEIANLEIICRELDSKNAPLICAYYHIYLAVYYNAKNVKDMYEYHLCHATGILSPRGWWVPLLEFAFSINYELLYELNPQFYRKIAENKKKMLSNYQDIGIFSLFFDTPRMDMATNIRVGYLIAQGKNNNEIAEELGISNYKIKHHIDDLCAIAGVSTRKEIKEFIIRNLHL